MGPGTVIGMVSHRTEAPVFLRIPTLSVLALAAIPSTPSCEPIEQDEPEAPTIQACNHDPLGLDEADLDAAIEGSEAFVPPTEAQRDALADALLALAADEVPLQSVADAGYDLCEAGDLVQLTPVGGSWATILLRRGQASNLLIEVPHALFEGGTLDEALTMMDTLSARAVLVTGTHRCANSKPSGCDGTTGVCNDDDDAPNIPFPDSDMAHVLGTAFHTAHTTLAEHYADHFVVSLHGMQRAGASVSNGTNDDIANNSPITELVAALELELPNETITTCNPGAGTYDDHLCGTTNAQGRHVNGAPDACEDYAQSANDRFIHLEQNQTVRDAGASVAAAFSAILD